MGRRISKEFLHPSILEGVNDKIGNLDELETNAKGNMVQAVNELLDKLGNSELEAEMAEGKELIANAIGEPVSSEDTFQDMSNDINGLLSTFKTNMMNNGVTVESGDKFKALIDKIATMVEEGSGKGIQFIQGSIQTIDLEGEGYYAVVENIPFKPDIIIIHDGQYNVLYDKFNDETIYHIFSYTNGDCYRGFFNNSTDIVTDNSFSLATFGDGGIATYYVIGVGEEDTALRDSLADILENKGVDVTEEDDMASLITKVDGIIADMDIKNIMCGYCTSFLIKKDNSLWGCGLKSNIGTTSDMSTFTHLMDDVKQVAANGTNGDQHVMVLKNDGTLWACGDNSKGQLGLGNTTDQKVFTQVTTNINNDVKYIACGSFYTMILKNDGTLWACGYNTQGQLGLGDTNQRTTFTQVTNNINNDVKQLACAFGNAWVLKNDGTLWACGDNSNGQLGLGDTNQRTTFTQITDNVKQIYTGVSSSVFIIKNDGTLWACGYNYYGQLGIGTKTSNPGYVSFTQVDIDATDIKCIACAHTVTVLIKTDGTLWACGYDSNNELGGLYPATSQSTFVKISQKSDNHSVCCGLDHVIVLKNDNSIWASGNNYYGQLGLGYVTTSSGVTGFNCVGGPF